MHIEMASSCSRKNTFGVKSHNCKTKLVNWQWSFARKSHELTNATVAQVKVSTSSASVDDRVEKPKCSYYLSSPNVKCYRISGKVQGSGAPLQGH